MKLTPARARALVIVRDNPGIGAARFAVKMWPDSTGHARRSHRHATPAGGAVGAGIKMRAGVFLGRLARDGLLAIEYRGGCMSYRGSGQYHLSAEGRRALDSMAG